MHTGAKYVHRDRRRAQARTIQTSPARPAAPLLPPYPRECGCEMRMRLSRHPGHRNPEPHQMRAEFACGRRFGVPPTNHAFVFSLTNPVLTALFSIYDLVGSLTISHFCVGVLLFAIAFTRQVEP